MEHDFDEETRVCRQCGLSKVVLLVCGNPPCGAIQLVAADDEPTPHIVKG